MKSLKKYLNENYLNESVCRHKGTHNIEICCHNIYHQ